MSLSTTITVDLSGFEKQINAEIKRMIRAIIVSASPSIQVKVGDILEDAIRSSPEYISLLGGKLYHELGVLNAQSAFSEIIAVIKKNIEVRYINTPGALGGISISYIRKNNDDVLSIPSAKFISEGGFAVEWLNWLLTKGDSIILIQYHYRGIVTPKSRTGQGLMIKGGQWRVPPEFSGTKDNNFLTRSCSSPDVIQKIAGSVQSEIQARL
jgi:hypothetical protein